MSGADIKQRLVAILAADVAGYSRLMSVDERATVAALDASREVFKTQIVAEQGRIVDMAGDSVLAVFETAIGAVSAALAIQDQLNAWSDAAPEAHRMRFRIGVHVGDILEKVDGTIYGDGVNIAARLEGLAEPGGIFVSDLVQGAVRDRLGATFENAGEHTVKNITRPVRAYRVHRPATFASSTLDTSLPDKPSIAVLPFANMSGDIEQEYFFDGIADDIIAALSRVPSFVVIARSSSFSYKGRAVDVRSVGRDLGVRYVLEGAVRKAADRVRITGRLVDAATGVQLWADRFDGLLDDVFDLQDKVTSKVVGAIEPRVQQAEIARALFKPTGNLTAYDLFLRAHGQLQALSEASLRSALGLLDSAIAADPSYSSAYGLAAWCCRLLTNYGCGDDEEIRARGSRMATRAVALGKDDPLALALGGAQVALLGGDYVEGLAHLERSLSLNPNSARAWELCGWVTWAIGQHGRSIECFETFMRLSPRDQLAALCYAGLAWPNVFLGKYDDAIGWADRAVREMPNSALGLRPQLVAATLAGKTDKANEALLRIRELMPHVSVAALMRIDISQPHEQRNLVEGALRQAGLTD